MSEYFYVFSRPYKGSTVYLRRISQVGFSQGLTARVRDAIKFGTLEEAKMFKRLKRDMYIWEITQVEAEFKTTEISYWPYEKFL